MSLSEKLTDPSKKAQVIDDCCRLIDQEVGDKGGLSGFAVKAAYSAVKGVKPGFVAHVVERLLPEFVGKLDPIWLGVMVGVNLQTSFLTPPFGFALFYLRGVAPARVTTGMIYKGVIPFVLLQIAALITLFFFPQLITWLPDMLY